MVVLCQFSILGIPTKQLVLVLIGNRYKFGCAPNNCKCHFVETPKLRRPSYLESPPETY